MQTIKAYDSSRIFDFYVSLNNEEKCKYPNGFWLWIATRAGSKLFFQFVEMSKNTKAKGHARYGAKGIIEIMRWHTPARDGGVTFKISNNYTSGLARLSMELEPELKGFFKVKA